MKRCSMCGVEKPRHEFHRHSYASDGLRSACRTCTNDRQRGPDRRDPEKRRKQRRADKRRLRETDPQKYWAQKNAENRRARARRRAKVFDHYGWACACCGSTEDPTIDHVGGDGHPHRLELFGYVKATARIYGWLIREGFPAGFMTLCRRCNSSKRMDDRCHLHPHAEVWAQIGLFSHST